MAGMDDIYITVDDEDLQMEMEIAIKSLGFENIRAWIEQDAERFLRERAENRFAAGGDDASGKWHPLADPDATHPILVRSGRLHSWITNADASAWMSGDDVVYRWPDKIPSDDYVRSGFLSAQFGTSTVPQRMVVASNSFDESMLAELLFNWTIGTWESGA